LGSWKTRAFALLCAERLYPAIARFSPDEASLTRGALDAEWSELSGHTSVGDREGTLAAVEAAIDRAANGVGGFPHGPAFAGCAEDALITVAYAIEAGGDARADRIAWVGQVSYDALDAFLFGRDDPDPNDADAMTRLQNDPMIQAELARQRRDLDELRDAALTAAEVARLRERAKAEGAQTWDEALLTLAR
jgi:hypothetical protein